MERCAIVLLFRRTCNVEVNTQFSQVYLVRHNEHYYAMKVLRKAHLLIHSPCHIQSEREILEALEHPFIVTLHYAFQSPEKLFLVLQYAQGGELFSWMEKERIFSEQYAVFYSAELILALSHLHSLGIIYRDLSMLIKLPTAQICFIDAIASPQSLKTSFSHLMAIFC